MQHHTITFYVFTAVLILIIGSFIAAPASATNPNRVPADTALELTLRPVRDGGREITAIEVKAEMRQAPPKATPFSVQAAITYASVTGIADRIQDLKVSDTSGVLPLETEDDAAKASGLPHFRHWRTGRQPVYPLSISYRSLPQTGRMFPGPQFNFRAHDGGFSAAGSGFLALPENTGITVTRAHWDLSDLDSKSQAASTFGDGDFVLDGDPFSLTQGFFMAGPVGRYASKDGGNPFEGYWLGLPRFNPQQEMVWASQSYKNQLEFYRDKSVQSYRTFLRAVPDLANGSGGTALQNSYIIAVPTGQGDPAIKGPRAMLAHEMGHMFVGSMLGKDSGPWYTEGLNEYNTHLILRRTGAESAAEFLKAMNTQATNYYSSRYRNASAAKLDEIGFSGGVGAGEAQNIPYCRGVLYFATVDSKIRAATGGKRKLEDVILEFLEQRRRGGPFDAATLISAFEKEYGQPAREDFDSLITRGDTIVPPSDAFGPGFERRPKRYLADGKGIDGYEWVRVPSVTEEECRKW